jgi:hypothetical protein
MPESRIYIIDDPRNIVTNECGIFTKEESKKYYDYFYRSLPWIHDEAVIYGRHIITKRKIVWFADHGYDYNYSGRSRIAMDWDSEVLEIKKHTGYSFKSFLLNLYPTGKE